MNIFKPLLVFSIFMASVVSSHADLLGAEWIDEAEMKKQSNFARANNLLLDSLRCKFREGVENPGRDDVEFRADFSIPPAPTPWGWTFEANAPNPGAEKQAKQAGFVVAYEDYYEITGVTWVKCKVWHEAN